MAGPTDWKRKLSLQAAGFCTIRGKKRLQGKWRCAACAERHRTAARERMRKKLGCKPWEEGGRGRPPIET